MRVTLLRSGPVPAPGALAAPAASTRTYGVAQAAGSAPVAAGVTLAPGAFALRSATRPQVGGSRAQVSGSRPG
ncbi:hypothetical protein OG883_34370 [Streptomyces sp. NBC_01142]|nr:hypothetical protein [Streptomyces sp. NBC_01142]